MQETARTVMWRRRIALWYESGLTQTAFAEEHGVQQRQISYWAKRLAAAPEIPGVLPVRIVPSLPVEPAAAVGAAAAAAPIMLRSEQGWSLALPGDVNASWLAELMRGL